MLDILNEIKIMYAHVLTNLPAEAQPFVSLILGVVVVVAVLQILKKNLIWLIVLVVLLPASISILRGITELLIKLLKFLFGIEA